MYYILITAIGLQTFRAHIILIPADTRPGRRFVDGVNIHYNIIKSGVHDSRQDATRTHETVYYMLCIIIIYNTTPIAAHHRKTCELESARETPRVRKR